jgi:hypothetical protein
METKSELIRVFSGSEITVNLLQYELEKEGIPTNIINDTQVGTTFGAPSGTPYSVDLYILDIDLEKANPIVEEFLKTNKMY